MKDLFELLGEVVVSEKITHDQSVVGWWPDAFSWCVETPQKGIVALFDTEVAALHYRLSLINQYLNEDWEKE